MVNLDHMIRIPDQVQMMFDHEDCMTFVDEAVKEFDETFDVTEVKADGRFFEYVEVA